MELRINAPMFFVWTVIVSFSAGMGAGLWAAVLPFDGAGWLVATAWLWCSGVVVLGLTACAVLRISEFRHADE